MEIQEQIDAFKSAITESAKSINARMDRFDDAITELAQKGERLSLAGSPKTLGDIAVKQFAENRDIFEKSRSIRLELKAAGDPVTTGQARTIATGDMGMPGMLAPIGLQNAFVTRQAVGTTALEYSRYLGIAEGAAGVQIHEGDAKAAVRPDWELITQTAIQIAGYTVLSRQALSDAVQLRTGVNVALGRSIATKVDDVLWNGAGGFEGFGTLATLHQSSVFAMLPDAISEAAAVMQVAGYSPDTVALHPSTWVEILTARGTSNDAYLSGNYLGEQEMVLRGLRVVISASVNAGRALLLDSTQTEILIVQNPALEIGYSGTQFTSNLCSALLETRIIPVFKSEGSAMYVVPEGMSI